MTDLDRLLSRVDYTNDGCWIWTGARQSKGYGSVGHGGRTHLAHRISWELHNGPIATGMTIDHLCGKKLCINPEHLEPVSLSENVARYNDTRTHCKAGHLLHRRTRGNGHAWFCPSCEKQRIRSPAPTDLPLFELDGSA